MLWQLEMKHLQDENNHMRKDLEIEREKLHTLEVAFEQMRKKGKELILISFYIEDEVICINMFMIKILYNKGGLKKSGAFVPFWFVIWMSVVNYWQLW